ncbi:hypothetical protein H5410_011689 [Solanum commersonii]|uniref:Uncharacterized protein n=1 Tax=Solanum commersonii TaxID=4109 RepID=A0A9J6AQT3_SOLCO|nr:hypothetical protein H5410_011689 [Solanum commersonii]
MVPACILWCLWIERNKRCFDGIPTPISSPKARCLISLFSWVNHSPVITVEFFLEFISSIVNDASNDARRYVQLGFQTKETKMSIGCISFDINVGIMESKERKIERKVSNFVRLIHKYKREGDRKNPNNGWQLIFRSGLNDSLNNASLENNKEYSLIWAACNDGKNRVAQCPRKATSKSKAPVKVTCFAWVAAKACPTQGTYRREVLLLVIDVICVKRSQRQSSIYDSLQGCRLCCELFLNMSGVKWVMPPDVKSLLKIWLERDRICFEGKRQHISRTKNRYLLNVYFLCKRSIMASMEQNMDLIEET